MKGKKKGGKRGKKGGGKKVPTPTIEPIAFTAMPRYGRIHRVIQLATCHTHMPHPHPSPGVVAGWPYIGGGPPGTLVWMSTRGWGRRPCPCDGACARC